MDLRRKPCLQSASAALLLALLLFAPAVALPAVPQAARSNTAAAVVFVGNAGQTDPAVRFMAIGAGAALFATDEGLWLSALAPAATESRPAGRAESATEPRAGATIEISFAGANQHPRIEPFDQLPARVSFLIGDQRSWHTDLTTWAGIRYVDIYPGIDLEVSSMQGQLTQRIVARAGANPDLVRLRVLGAERIDLAGGQLRMTTPIGTLALPLPELVSATPRPASAPSLAGDTVSQPFAPNTSSSAIAGATDLAYAVALGGAGVDYSYGIAVDSGGAAYITGNTTSPNFTPAPGDPLPDPSFGNAFVARLDPSGGLAFATFIGGQGDDAGFAIALDPTGAIYLTGATTSIDFPTTAGAYDRSYANDTCDGHPHFPAPCPDAFVAKLTPSGSGLAYATLLGGADRDVGLAIALGADQTTYIAGVTRGGVAATPGAFDTTPGGGLCPGALLPVGCTDGFIMHLNSAGTGVLYSTLLGGGFGDTAAAIALGGDGSAYAAGSTTSPDFPVTPGAYDTSFQPGECASNSYLINYDCAEAFVVKLNPAGSAASYATLLGGKAADQVNALALDPSGAAYVAGETRSTDFPTTPGAFQRTLVNGSNCDTTYPCLDAFAAKLSPAGNALQYATLLGGSEDDTATSLAVNAQGEVFLGGTTKSATFPVTPGAASTTLTNSLGDAFVARLNATGSDLAYSGLVGGLGQENPPSLAIDSAGNAYLTSSVNAYYADSPPAPPYASGDAFAVKLAVPPFIYQNSAVIAPAGGSLTTTLDATSYSFPSGAFAGAATITHTVLLERGLPSTVPLFSIGHSFENTATLALGGPPAQLAKPYTIVVHYSAAELRSAIESTLALYSWDGQAWVAEPSSVVNTAQNTITASPNHFGRWAVLGNTNNQFLPAIQHSF